MSRRWIVGLLMVGVVVLGVTGGTVLAQGEGEDGESPVKSFASRVAAILGLDVDKVEDAFTQARGEMQDEALQARLDDMVESGRMTQEQAHEYKDWFQARPESFAPGLQGLRDLKSRRGMTPRGRMKGGMWGGMKGGMWHGKDCDRQFLAPPTPEPSGGDTV